ncbi:MAG: hypothetical protein Athens101428_732, partial [Candidatus Berkelbacteria bacterium Athens1014_28]
MPELSPSVSKNQATKNTSVVVTTSGEKTISPI